MRSDQNPRNLRRFIVERRGSLFRVIDLHSNGKVATKSSGEVWDAGGSPDETTVHDIADAAEVKWLTMHKAQRAAREKKKQKA